MNEIAIYLEGAQERGEGSAQQKAELRTGMDFLLRHQKQAAQIKGLRWRLKPCGSRNGAFETFVRSSPNQNDETLSILLVDAEDSLPPEVKNNFRLNCEVRRNHLHTRDGWDLKAHSAECIHLMVQCMEAWIVADPEALASYYGRGFVAKSLPNRQNLEDEPKTDVYSKLKKATEKTKKGEYNKGRHASKLLGLIDPQRVSARCPRFASFTAWLDDQIRRA